MRQIVPSLASNTGREVVRAVIQEEQDRKKKVKAKKEKKEDDRSDRNGKNKNK